MASLTFYQTCASAPLRLLHMISLLHPVMVSLQINFLIICCTAIKQRLQLCNTLTARQAFKDILKEGGFRMLYKSYPITVMMNVPFASSVVCCNENLKTLTKPWERTNPLGWYFLCAGLSGAVAGLVTNPFDVVKTRL